MKTDLSGTVTCRLRQSFGGVSPAQRVIAATSGGAAALTGGANWEKFEAHFSVPILAGYTIGGADSALVLEFVLPAGGGYVLDVAQVQMEQSTLATEFETQSVLYEYGRCQRYYEFHAGVLASQITNVVPCYYFNTRKYRAPDLTLLAGYTGTGGAFTPLLDVGYYQSTVHSVVAVFFILVDAEIYIVV